jgi:two-component system, cell cycle sensor histidine kinase and response regulator CckA
MAASIPVHIRNRRQRLAPFSFISSLLRLGYLALALQVLPGCAAGTGNGAELPVLVGINTDFPPYEFMDKRGEAQGFDVDLLRGAAQATGLDIRFQPGPWDQIRGDLEAGRIGLLAGMLRSEERERYAEFSSPCLVVFYGIFVRKDSRDIHSLEDLRGRRILVENGSQMHEHLKLLGYSREIQATASEPAALKALAAGTGDAALVPLLMGAMQVRDAGITNVQRVGDSVYSRELCFAATKGDLALVERLNTGLAILNQTGEYARIYQKWFRGLDPREDTLLALARRAAWLLVPLAGVAVSALAWTWFLRRQVLQRTRELLRANQALHEKERFLQAVVENLPVAVYGKDPNRDYAYTIWNARCIQLFDLTPLEALGRTDADLESPEAAALFRRTDEEAFRKRSRIDLPDDFFHSRHGELVLQHTVKVPIFDEEGQPWLLLAISEDVTQKRRTEQELVRSRAGLAEAQRIAHLGSWEWNADPSGLQCSEELHRILELDPSGPLPSFQRLLRYCHPADRGTLLRALRKAIHGNHAVALDHRIVLPSGRLRHLHSTLKAQSDASSKVVRLYGTALDLTERKNAEEVLRQAQKLEGLGVLAGGIAHDFNNLLTAILANLNLAQATLPETAKASQYLRSMETTVLRAADLTRQMLAYSGRGTFVIQVLDLNQVAQEITQLLTASISKKVEIRFTLQPILPRVEADIAQLQQVLMNLVTNASEAIGEQEGVITLATGTLELSLGDLEAAFPGQDMNPGTFVVLTVTDTGCGMTPEVRERLFEPFFTTKFSGRGLGLSALRGILKGHRAGIRIESEPGRGSSFRIYFPAAKASLAIRPEEPEARTEPSCSSGTILVVDDEPVVRASTAEMLERIGYTVLEARDGLEALETFRRAPGEISLVLLDLTMPRMDGHETLRELQKLQPDVKVILCSGYHEQEAMKETRLGDSVGFLPKPFRFRDLRSALEKLSP